MTRNKNRVIGCPPLSPREPIDGAVVIPILMPSIDREILIQADTSCVFLSNIFIIYNDVICLQHIIVC